MLFTPSDMKIFDIESDGLLDTITKIHCINVIDRATGRRLRFNEGRYYDRDGNDIGPSTPDGSIEDGLKLLHGAYCVGQNIIGYDVPAIQKLYPWFKPAKVFDTKVAAQVIWTNLADVDFGLLRSGKLPLSFQKSGLIGRNSLEAWGWRLGFNKGDFSPTDHGHTWATCPFLPEMDDYCVQDVEVTLKFVEKIEAKNYSAECLELEHRVAELIFEQVQRGFAFDRKVAEKLVAVLQVRRAELADQLAAVFPPWEAIKKEGIAKANNKKLGRVKGQPYVVKQTVVFNPSSRDHIAGRLQAIHGWVPTEFTPEGKPKIDETVLEALPYPEARLLAEYFLVQKRLGQIAEGKKAWFKEERNGRIHGGVNTNGAVTGRMTHSEPNLAQVPAAKYAKDGSPLVGAAGGYGFECRSCFTATALATGIRLALVGCDAEGLELRMLGHYMARWDGGAYSDTVVNGRKEDETDVHNVNKRAAGLNSRDSAKTFIYALIYGAGDFKLGSIVFDDFTPEQQAKFLEKHTTHAERNKALSRLGTQRRARIMENLPALGELVKAVKAAVKDRGQLRGLDGRVLHVRSSHSALNTLLQSAGAVAMKKALVILADAIAASPELAGRVWFVANVHDEFQAETYPEIADVFGRLASDAIRLAGEHFNLRCPLAGAYAVGANWAETH